MCTCELLVIPIFLLSSEFLGMGNVLALLLYSNHYSHHFTIDLHSTFITGFYTGVRESFASLAGAMSRSQLYIGQTVLYRPRVESTPDGYQIYLSRLRNLPTASWCRMPSGHMSSHGIRWRRVSTRLTTTRSVSPAAGHIFRHRTVEMDLIATEMLAFMSYICFFNKMLWQPVVRVFLVHGRAPATRFRML